MTILIICVYALNRNNQGKLNLPSTFQTSDIELLKLNMKRNIHLTNSPKRDHIFKLRLNCLILTS